MWTRFDQPTARLARPRAGCLRRWLPGLRAGVGLAVVASAVVGTGAAAQATKSADATSKALVITPLSFFESQPMHFGDILASTTANGTVRLYPNGTRTATGGIVLAGNTHQPATFAGRGRQNQSVQVWLTSVPVWLNGPGGARMRVTQFEVGSTPTAILTTTPRRFTITGATGAFNFPLGATLDVARNQPEGTYVGTYEINLVYQ